MAQVPRPSGWRLMAVASGEIDSAIAVGVEKMTDSLPTETTSALATAADADWEVIHGLSFVSINALVMQRYMYEYGWEQADFAPFSINAHANAVHNPNARLQFPISPEAYQKAAMISTPINLTGCFADWRWGCGGIIGSG